MELRRPTLADKETILNMMAEFEETQSAHDGGFWDAENFDYENWLETNLNKEMGIGLPENRVPSIQFVLFDESGHGPYVINDEYAGCDFNPDHYHYDDGDHYQYGDQHCAELPEFHV